MKGRMMLFVASITACQFSPIHLTPSAADQVGVASVYSHESGSATASGEKLDHEAFTVALAVAGIWLAIQIADMRKNQDCLLSGRRNCAPIDVKALER